MLSDGVLERWSLPMEAKNSVLDAIKEMDRFFSQLATLEDSDQRQIMTAALQRVKAALMKKLGVGTFAEYLELETIIVRDLNIVKREQAEMLALRRLKNEGHREDDGRGTDVATLDGQNCNGLRDSRIAY